MCMTVWIPLDSCIKQGQANRKQQSYDNANIVWELYWLMTSTSESSIAWQCAGQCEIRETGRMGQREVYLHHMTMCMTVWNPLTGLWVSVKYICITNSVKVHDKRFSGIQCCLAESSIAGNTKFMTMCMTMGMMVNSFWISVEHNGSTNCVTVYMTMRISWNSVMDQCRACLNNWPHDNVHDSVNSVR
jgi:hypothetical protein